MESWTKRRLSSDELHAMVREAFGSGAEVAAWSELPDGTYNATYAVALSNPELDLVLKVAPDPTLELLTYEVDLMRTEAHFYRRAAAVAVPVPQVVFADFSRRLLATDYVFVSRLPGSSLRTLRDEMSLEELGEVRTELAKLAARLHTATESAFGYPLRSSRSWQPTWRASFSAMVDDLVSDAVRLGSELPAPPEAIAALLHRHDDVLDDVERPALVHFDLWDGNVFVDRAPGGRWRITGLIDGERAFFGDPVAEFVSLALYRDLAEIPELLTGYAAGSDTPPPWLSVGAHASVALTRAGRRRLLLYSAYLYLVMCIEGVTRGFDGPEHEGFRQRVLALLELQLERLDSLRSSQDVGNQLRRD